jgi:hypothetical protein
MILRRVIEHVQEQNWTAIGIDFLIVVLGVYLGIQLGNWNEARQNLRDEARLLVELGDDLAADVNEMEDVLENAEIRISAIEQVLDAAGQSYRGTYSEALLTYDLASSQWEARIDDLAEYEPQNAYDYPLAVTFMRTLDGNRHTYNTLISMGGVRLIEDRELARMIQAYYARVDEVQDLEAFIVEARHSVFDAMQRQGISRVDERTLADLGEVIGSDPRLVATLRDFRYMTFNQWGSMLALQSQAQALARALEERS